MLVKPRFLAFLIFGCSICSCFSQHKIIAGQPLSYAVANKLYMAASRLSAEANFNDAKAIEQESLNRKSLFLFKQLILQKAAGITDSLLFHCYLNAGLLMHFFDSLPQAKTFYLQAISFREKLPVIQDSFFFKPYLFAGSILYAQNLFDSAFIFYDQALQLATTIKDTVWMGIVSGNMAQVLYMQGKYDTAYELLKSDYRASKKSGYYDNAANSLQWAARANLGRGNKTVALAEVREAFQLLKLWPDASYLRNAYYTTTQIFREMGDYDSAFYYNNLWSAINDSLEKVVATSSLAITKARLNDETSRYNIQNLNKEKRSQLLFRNIMMAGIVVLSLFVLLMVNRNRLKTKMKMENSPFMRDWLLTERVQKSQLKPLYFRMIGTLERALLKQGAKI